MSVWKWRMAELADAEAFSQWVSTNPQIDSSDILAGLKKNNPTVLYFAVERDGVVQAFAPVYLQMLISHLGFNPDADGKDRLRALEMLKDGISAIAVQHGIREIVTMSKEEYPVAQWALKHGFDLEPRQALKLDLNKQMALAEV